jgi:hypothetical protein
VLAGRVGLEDDDVGVARAALGKGDRKSVV